MTARRPWRRLRSRTRRQAVGVNIGKTRAVAGHDAPADYAASASLLAGVADYVVVNVSSPNTPGLRNLQQPAHLRPLLTAVCEALDTAGTRARPAAGQDGPRPGR